MQFNNNIAAILVNWRGAEDTIECLASLYAAKSTPYIVIVDNASGDGSVEKIAAWADSKSAVKVADERHENPAYAQINRPLDYEIRNYDSVANGLHKPLTIIRSSGNLGFAGGNNIGLRAALATEAIHLFWLLNNDTIIAPDAVAALETGFAENPDWGMAGGPIRLYHRPTHHQLVNGMRFDPLTAKGSGILAGSPVTAPLNRKQIIAETDFVCGASLCMTRRFADDIGLLEERFFLYFEEIDLATRAKGKFAIGFVPDAIVYHKEGASAGSPGEIQGKTRSTVSEYHMIRSKMIFARKHYPWLVPFYHLQNFAIIARRLLRKQPVQAKVVWQAMRGKPLSP